MGCLSGLRSLAKTRLTRGTRLASGIWQLTLKFVRLNWDIFLSPSHEKRLAKAHFRTHYKRIAHKALLRTSTKKRKNTNIFTSNNWLWCSIMSCTTSIISLLSSARALSSTRKSWCCPLTWAGKETENCHQFFISVASSRRSSLRPTNWTPGRVYISEIESTQYYLNIFHLGWVALSKFSRIFYFLE